VRRLLLSVAIAVVFAVAAQIFVGWRALVYPWLFIDDPLSLSAAVGLLGATYVIRALRLYRYFHLRRGFMACVRVLLQHTLLINLLPFRTGELAFPALMSRYFGMPAARSLAALVWLRALDFHVLVWIPLLLVTWAATPTVAAVAGVLCVLWLGALFAALLLARSPRIPEVEAPTKLAQIARDVLAAVPATAGELMENWFLTLLNWALKLAVFAWIIRVFSGEPYMPSLVGAIGGELSSVLPIQGIAGIGTYEAGVVAAMSALGVAVSTALTGAVNLHFLFLGVSIVGAGVALLIPTPGVYRREGQSTNAPLINTR